MQTDVSEDKNFGGDLRFKKGGVTIRALGVAKVRIRFSNFHTNVAYFKD